MPRQPAGMQRDADYEARWHWSWPSRTAFGTIDMPLAAWQAWTRDGIKARFDVAGTRFGGEYERSWHVGLAHRWPARAGA